MRARLGVSLIALLAASPAAAQIVADTAPGRALGTTVATNGAITSIDGGTLSGTNLFHSFSDFSVGAGGVAQWVRSAGDGASIRNVVNRVTGGGVSQIDGTLDSTALPNADFFFINPAGIVFGVNAVVNVPNAAYFSTASRLDFADGASFLTATPGGSTLSIAAPEAFGFLGAEGNIVLNGTGTNTPFVPQRGSLSLTAANVGLFGAGMDIGGIDLFAVGAVPTTIAFANPFANLGQAGFVTITGSAIASRSTDDTTAGAIRIGGAAIDISNSAIASFAQAGGDAGQIALLGSQIDISQASLVGSAAAVGSTGDGGRVDVLSGLLQVRDGSSLVSRGLASGDAGLVTVNSGGVFVDANSRISSETGAGSTGRAGLVTVSANDVLVSVLGFISSRTFGSGDAGDVVVDADNIDLVGGLIGSQAGPGSTGKSGDTTVTATRLGMQLNGQIGALAFGSGDAGNVFVDVDTIVMDASLISSGSQNFATGNAGEVHVKATDLTLRNSAEINSSAFGAGLAGVVDVTADTILLDGAFIDTQNAPGSSASAGDISVAAGALTLINNASIASTTFGSGSAGSVAVAADTISIVNGSIRSLAEAGSSGNGGSVTINAGAVGISGLDGRVASSTFGLGHAGSVSITADGLLVDGGSILSSAENGSAGDAGTVDLDVGQLFVVGGARVATSTFGPGNAGKVTIGANDMLVDASLIASTANPGSSGKAGTIAITVGNMFVRNTSTISSSTSGTGDAGSVLIAGDIVSIDNSTVSSESGASATGAGGAVGIGASNSLEIIHGSRVTATTFGAGLAGNIGIIGKDVLVDAAEVVTQTAAGATGNAGFAQFQADTLTIRNGARVASSTAGAGNAGGVLLGANTILVQDARVDSQADAGTGNAGLVAIQAGSMTVRNGQISSSTFTSGQAGGVLAVIEHLEVDNSFFGSATVGTGNAGSTQVQTLTTHVTNRGAISSSTFAGGDAGDVVLEANDLLIDNNGFVVSSADAASTGDAGSVSVFGGSVTVASQGQISSSTRGLGDAGNVEVRADSILVDDADITSDAFAGAGRAGNVTIAAGAIALTNAGNISSDTFSVNDGGNLSITADAIDVGEGTFISSSTFSSGHAGSVTILASALRVAGGITSDNAPNDINEIGNAGSIAITADLLDVDGGIISTSTQSAGLAGNVTINAGTALVGPEGVITSSTTETGDAGGVTITAGTLIVDGSVSSASRPGASDPLLGGRAGTVTIQANALRVNSTGEIVALTQTGGAAGDISLKGGSAIIDGGTVASSTESLGDAGIIDIELDSLSVLNGGRLASTTSNAGDAGLVFLITRAVIVDGEGSISSSALDGSSGQAGGVVMQTQTLTVSGAGKITSDAFGTGDAGDVLIDAPTLTMRSVGQISSSTFGPGAGGFVAINAGVATLDNALILSETLGAGNAGNVSIQAQSLNLANFSAISSATGSSGNAGAVTIGADSIAADTNALITSSTFGAGDAGRVFVLAGMVDVARGAAITSGAVDLATGKSGSVLLVADALSLRSGGRIETSSANNLTAGSVGVVSTSVLIDGQRSAISSENISSSGGAAGSVGIGSSAITVSNGGAISTNAVSGPAGNINIQMPTTGILKLQGKLLPGTITTSSGPGTGGAISIASPYAIISNGGRILAKGQQGGADVVISSQFFIRSTDRLNLVSVDGTLVLDSQVEDVSGGTVVEDIPFIDAGGVLKGQCSAIRASGEASQFNVRGVGPYVATPPAAPTGGVQALAFRPERCS